MCPACVLLCVVCVSVWSWFALQFALQDLKITLANTPSVHPLFVLHCIVYYKCVCVCVCVCVCACAPKDINSDHQLHCQRRSWIVLKSHGL